jgi:hypothetical protein
MGLSAEAFDGSARVKEKRREAKPLVRRVIDIGFSIVERQST